MDNIIGSSSSLVSQRYKNWEVKHIPTNNGNKGINPCLINSELNLIIKIPHESLNVFGYRSAGCELGIIGKDEKGNEKEQNAEILKIVSNELSIQMREPNFWDIKNYLKNYKGKRKLSAFVAPSKKTIESIKKVLQILEEDWQELNKLSNSRDVSYPNR